jgi:hypothetical protein
MTTEIIEITHDGKLVQYNTTTKKWAYDAVAEDIVKKLNPTLSTAIEKALESSVIKYQERIEAENKRKEAEERKAKQDELAKFKELVTPLVPDGFTASFAVLDSYRLKYVSISKSDVSASLEYDKTVYHSKSWHSSSTDLVWVVEFNYKKQRFANIDKAIANLIKKIDEEVARRKSNDEWQEKENAKRNSLKDQLDKIGISFRIKSEWVRGWGRHDHGHQKETKQAFVCLNKGREVSGRTSDDLSISDVAIVGTFTAQQFVALTEFIRELNIRGDK